MITSLAEVSPEKKASLFQRQFGRFGGCYMPELLLQSLEQLLEDYSRLKDDNSFQEKLKQTLCHYAGRPTPLTEVKRFSQAISGPKVYLKREDLLHTGAHKLNNALGQCLLAQHTGKKRIIAETGAGQHGVATATACAYLGLDCVVYMGEVDIKRQAPNVKKMKLLGADVRSVFNGSATLKDAINEALRDWTNNFENTHYCLGSALGPHPYPQIVEDFQRVIGEEVQKQVIDYGFTQPDLLIACVGGGSNAIGLFAPFLENSQIQMVGVEAGGEGVDTSRHAARFATGRPGVLHGCYTYLLQNEDGQVLPTHSISAGLDYPAVGPHHAQLFEEGRVSYQAVTDKECLQAFRLLAQSEGIIPALESSHALAYLIKIAPQLAKDCRVVVNLSGSGQKDLPQVLPLLEKELS